MLQITGPENTVPQSLIVYSLKSAWEHLCPAASNGYSGLMTLLYLFYSCFNTDLFHIKHGPQMAPESTVSVPKEILGSLFFLIFFQKKKARILFVCYGLM